MSDTLQPYASPSASPEPAKPRSFMQRFRILEILVAIAVCGLLVMLLIPAT